MVRSVFTDRPVGYTAMWMQAIRSLWNTRLGMAGAILTTISGCAILAALIIEVFGRGLGAYQGLISFLLLPAVFVAGLTLMPVGYLLQRRARVRGGLDEEHTTWVIDFSQPKRRGFLFFAGAITGVNVILLAVVSYEGYHYTESTKFCGTLCHSVMEPEYTAYQRSPHARVGCVECHIGSGASWFVKSKLSGVRQVVAVWSGDFSRPIPTPIVDLRPARETCEQCHWPEVFHGNRAKIWRRVPEDGRIDDPEITAVMLHVGGLDKRSGAYTGIHWHVSQDNRVEYRARDAARTQIRDVRVVRPDGTKTLFELSALDPLPDNAPWRTMDCVDCHNRPSHIYDLAGPAIDRQLFNRRLDASLPELKRAALQIVKEPYDSRARARTGIRDSLLAFYRQAHPAVARERQTAIEKAAEVLYTDVYAPNVYPELGIRWGTYLSRLGHEDGVGCFRCHNDEHTSADGEVIAQDCDTCHALIVEEERESAVDPQIKELIF